MPVLLRSLVPALTRSLKPGFFSATRALSTLPSPPVAPLTFSPDFSLSEFTVHFSGLLADWSVDAKLTAAGLLLTLVQFHLADRAARLARATTIEDKNRELMSEMDKLASQARKMRHEATSLQMVGGEFVDMHKKILAASEGYLIQSRSVLRGLDKISVLPEICYGPAFKSLISAIKHNDAITKFRLSVILSENQRIIDHKQTSRHLTIEDLTISPPLSESERGVHSLIHDLPAYIHADDRRAIDALDADRLDAQLVILTNVNLKEAMRLINHRIMPDALSNFSKGLEPFDPPTRNRLAGFCLRAAATNLRFDPSVSDILQKFYQENPTLTKFLKTMSSDEASNLIKWHAAAKLMCHISGKGVLQNMKGPSAVPSGLLGIMSLREAQMPLLEKEKRVALLQEAVDYFEKAITDGPFRAYYRIYRAHAERLRNNMVLAFEDIERALKEDPDNAYGHVMKARFLLKRGEIEAAKKEAEWHTRVPKTNPFVMTLVYNTLSELHQAVGETAKSVEFSQLSREMDPLAKIHKRTSSTGFFSEVKDLVIIKKEPSQIQSSPSLL